MLPLLHPVPNIVPNHNLETHPQSPEDFFFLENSHEIEKIRRVSSNHVPRRVQPIHDALAPVFSSLTSAYHLTVSVLCRLF